MAKQYLELLRTIQSTGTKHEDRTGTGTTRIFGAQLRFDLSLGFPILTTKRVWWKGVVEELLWMLSGSTNVKDLQDRGVTIWDEWGTAEQCARFGRKEGDLGPVYGHLWRNFGATRRESFGSQMDEEVIQPTGYHSDGIDQIAEVIRLLIENPNSRRILLTGWDPMVATQVALPPCHTLTHFAVIDGKLSSHLYQRSADVFLGVPFNIASYALLTHLLAFVCGLGVGDFIHSFGDVHVYSNHEKQVAEQLGRYPKTLPKLTITHDRAMAWSGGPPGAPGVALAHLLDITRKDVDLKGYYPDPVIKAEVSV